MTRLGNLSPPDFEDLCRDIIQAETGQRFSAFGAGTDGGVDGRHSKGPQSTVLQRKHFLNSTFSQLKSALSKEVPKIDLLKPSRYIFLTSKSLTPARGDELADVLGDRLKHPQDIWGAEDVEAALKRHPDIEKAHLKLWMSTVRRYWRMNCSRVLRPTRQRPKLKSWMNCESMFATQVLTQRLRNSSNIASSLCLTRQGCNGINLRGHGLSRPFWAVIYVYAVRALARPHNFSLSRPFALWLE